MSDDPLAAYRRERWQSNNMDAGLASEAEKPQTPLTEHQALELAIGALNEIPNSRLNGEFSSTYKLIPVLKQAYEDGKETEHLRDAAPELREALQNLWGVCDANNYEVPMGYRNQIFTALAKAAPAQAPSQQVTKEIDIEIER